MASVNQINPKQALNKVPGNMAGALSEDMGLAHIQGEKVRVHQKSMQAILEDAAEELTFAHSEKIEKDMSRRKIRSRSGKGVEAAAAADRIRAYLDKVPELEKNKRLASFIEELRKHSGRYSQEDFYRAARGFSDDETLQYLALLSAQQQLMEEGADESQLRGLNQAIQQLYRQSGPAIRAGLNVSAVAAEHAKSQRHGDAQSLRALYRDSVLDYQDLSGAYKKMTESHPARDFQKTVQFILAALSADLSAAESSIDKTRLQAVIKDIQQLRLLGGLHESCRHLLDKMTELYNEKPGATEDFMRALVDIVDLSWYNSSRIRQLPIDLQIKTLDAQVYFMREFKQIIKGIPMKFYASDYGRRDKFVASVQEAMDTVIDEENAGL